MNNSFELPKCHELYQNNRAISKRGGVWSEEWKVISEEEA